MKSPDSIYFNPVALMKRSLELAARGEGAVEPNPMVGAVVVSATGEIVGEGWHEAFGGPHAEVHALLAAGPKAAGGTLFVTLEPCCHQGKTPPCTQAIIRAGLERVVVAMEDPFPAVAGKGIEELRAAGIQVEVGLLQEEAQELNLPFTTLTRKKRPYVHAKWAMTWDGKIASRNGSSQWISNEASRRIVHELRRRMDGILVGIGTVRRDDPLLTARPAGERHLLRIVLDPRASLDLNSRLLQSREAGQILIVCGPRAASDDVERLRDSGAEVLMIGSSEKIGLDLQQLVLELGKRKLTNLLIEGGSGTLGAFFDAQLIDETHLFVCPKLIGGEEAISPIGGTGLPEMPLAVQPRVIETRLLEGDVYLRGRIRQGN